MKWRLDEGQIEVIDDAKHAGHRAELETIAKIISGLINGLDNREFSCRAV